MHRFFRISDEEADQFRLCGFCDETISVGRINFGSKYIDMDVSVYGTWHRFDFVLSFESDEMAEFVRCLKAPMLFYDSISNALCVFDDASTGETAPGMQPSLFI